MQYHPYFKLQLLHRYYAEHICADFIIAPTAACQRLLRNHRCVFKPSVNGFQMLVPLEHNQRPVVPLTESLSWVFVLRLKNPNFVSFTQFESEYQASQSLYVFSNDGFKVPGSSDLGTTVVQRQAKLPADRSPLEAQCAATLAALPFSQRSSVFGLVILYNNGSLAQDFSDMSEFNIRFAAKQQVWTYYLVADKGTSTKTFSIQDERAELTFSSVKINPRDRIVTAIQQRFPDRQPILLQSSRPIPCQQYGRPNLQLLKQGHSKPWIPHLPNPPNHHGTQVINLLEDV